MQWQNFELPRREDKVLHLAITLAVGAVVENSKLPDAEIVAQAC
jgi:hypothetical protein